MNFIRRFGIEKLSADRQLRRWLAPQQEIKCLQTNGKPYAYHCHFQQLLSWILRLNCMTKQGLTCRSRSVPSPASASGAAHHSPWPSRWSERQPHQRYPLHPPTNHVKHLNPWILPVNVCCSAVYSSCPLSSVVYCFWSSTLCICLLLAWIPPD